jgi:formate hydrogenlyase subunit 6/NADH:ubiquinone oxidoreductase subunit I
MISEFLYLVKSIFKKSFTINYPNEEHLGVEGIVLPTERFKGIHVNDLSKCTGCGECAKICQNEAIKMISKSGASSEEKKMMPMINYGRCCWCGLCVEVCEPESLRFTPEFRLINTRANSFSFVPMKRNLP